MEALVNLCDICLVFGVVRHTLACTTISTKLTKCQYIWKELSRFVYLLHVVTHPWKLQHYHAVLVGYGLSCPKFFEITLPKSLERVDWFC